MTMAPTPTKIEKHSDTEMLIEWSDGRRAIIPFTELRFQCPCAGCVDEVTGQRVIQRENIPADIRPMDVSLVGRYAIKISWSDGHTMGMYSFDRLRHLGS